MSIHRSPNSENALTDQTTGKQTKHEKTVEWTYSPSSRGFGGHKRHQILYLKLNFS